MGGLVVIVALVAAWSLRSGSTSASRQDVMVFAAASLQEAIREIGAAFSVGHTAEPRVDLNIAGSNVLAEQILASSVADVFISADEFWMDRVQKAGRLIEGTRKTILSNRLVVVAHRTSDWKVSKPEDLAAIPFHRLALGDPDAVPAGRYAKAFLANVHYGDGTLWDAVAARVVPTLDVRAALALVQADPSVIAIVYRTDAASSRDVRVLFEVPTDEAPPIRYSAARIERPAAPEAAAAFYRFLFSDEGQAIFAEHGFIPITQRSAPR
jgi:molybdate transport system substrate-binding protein